MTAGRRRNAGFARRRVEIVDADRNGNYGRRVCARFIRTLFGAGVFARFIGATFGARIFMSARIGVCRTAFAATFLFGTAATATTATTTATRMARTVLTSILSFDIAVFAAGFRGNGIANIIVDHGVGRHEIAVGFLRMFGTRRGSRVAITVAIAVTVTATAKTAATCAGTVALGAR